MAKKSIGRPSQYDPSFCEKIIELGAQGDTFATICMKLGIRSRSTFYDWIDKYPDFKEAYETCKFWWQGHMEDVGNKMMTGKIKGSHQVWNRMMEVKAGEEYKRLPNNSVSLHIGDVTNISQLSSDDLKERAKQLLSQLNIGNVIEGEVVTPSLEKEDTNVS